MNHSESGARPTVPKLAAAACWLGAALTSAGALAAAFTANPFIGPALLLSGVLIVLRSVRAAVTALRPSGEYRAEKSRILQASFAAPLTLATLVFAVAVIAQLTRLANIL